MEIFEMKYLVNQLEIMYVIIAYQGMHTVSLYVNENDQKYVVLSIDNTIALKRTSDLSLLFPPRLMRHPC